MIIADIVDIVMWGGYVEELSEFYHQKNLQVNISTQSEIMAQKVILYTDRILTKIK